MEQYTFAESVAAFKKAEEELARWKREFYMVEVWEPCDCSLQDHLGDWLVAHGAIYDGWVAHESYHGWEAHESYHGYGCEYFVPASLGEAWEAYRAWLENEIDGLENEVDFWAK